MINDDTISLLSECNAGIKMAVSSIDEVLPKVQDQNLMQSLNICKQEHEKLGNETHQLLSSYSCSAKEPNVLAKGMSWVKTNVKLTMDQTDNTVADLIVDGCNMGIKSLSRYLNQYQAADETAKTITKQLIKSEESLSFNLRTFL